MLRMAHINTGAGEKDLTVSAFIMRTDFDEPKILFHLHRKFATYMQIGGHVEKNQNPWQALEMEVREESGYEMSQLMLLQPPDRIKKLTGAIIHPQPMSINTHPISDPTGSLVDHAHIDLEYAFVTEQEPKHKVAKNESQDFALFTRDELIKLDRLKILDNIREIGLFMFDVCQVKWERIPAADI
jgi:8-oxo-dGTP pyrophosphatase MutT (NUDIX family)